MYRISTIRMRMFALLLVCIFVSHFSYAQIITRVAGSGLTGFYGDGGLATTAWLQHPRGLAIDAAGTMYIADAGNNRIRRVTASGYITTIAGSGTAGFGGDGGLATAALLDNPTGVAVDGSGNIYIADCNNNRIRMVNAAGYISTVAGSGPWGSGTGSFTGDGTAAITARLNAPYAVAIDGSGNMYISDNGNNRVRKVNTGGIINTIAGDGTAAFGGDGGAATAAQLYGPNGLALDVTNNVYVADAANNRVRKITPAGIITTVAGNGSMYYSGDGGAATAASFQPSDVAIDASGNIIIASPLDTRVRKVNASGIISTIAGAGYYGYAGDGYMATDAALEFPTCVAADAHGYVYISDYSADRVRKIDTCGFPAVAPIAAYSDLCAGASITVTDVVPGGVWTSSNSAVVTVNSSTGVVYGVAMGSANIRYTVTNGCGTASTEVSTPLMFVYPLPTIGTVSGAAEICMGSTTTFTASGSTSGGVWTSSAPTVATVSGSGAVTGLAGGAATISFSLTNSCGTVSSTRATNVSVSPYAGIITGPSAACVGTNITLSDTATGGNWDLSNSFVAYYIGGSGVAYCNSTGIDTFWYVKTNACGSDTAMHIVNILAAPHAWPISGLTGVCEGGATTTLTAPTTGGTWTSTDLTLATITSAGVVTGVATGYVTISYSVSNFCGMDSTAFPMVIEPIPFAGIASGVTNICAGGDTTLITITGSTAGTGGVWLTSDTAIANGFWVSTSTLTGGVIAGNHPGTTVLYYFVATGCGSDSTAVTITVDSIPATGTITGPITVCAGDVITLTNTATGGIWSSTNTSVATVNSTGITHLLTAGTATISYSFANGCGSFAATHPLIINALPNAGTISGIDSVCPGATISLATTGIGGAWSSANTAIATINTAGIVSGVASGTVTISYLVSAFCGNDTATYPVLVRTPESCHTDVNDVTGTPASLAVYPNPNNGTLTLKLTSAVSEEAAIVITNILGEKINESVTASNKETTLHINAPAGIYFMSVATKNDRATTRFVIE